MVEKILDHRKRKGEVQWLVKWKNSEKQTWGPAESFVREVQRDWLEYNKQRKVEVSMSDLGRKANVHSLRMRLCDGLPFSAGCALCTVLQTGNCPEFNEETGPSLCTVCGCE